MSSEALNPRNEGVQTMEAFHSAGTKRGISHRGFAAMSPEQQKQIASKGGEAVSKNREHMAEIGRKGGEASRGGGRGNNNKERSEEE